MRKVSWWQVSDSVKLANPTLWKLISAINPDENLPLLLADYHYGDLIINSGVMQYPNKRGELTPLYDQPHEVKNLLRQSVVPLGLILNRSVEVFSHDDVKVMPINTLQQGEIIGVFEFLSLDIFNMSELNISAGARTVFMLPNVSDSVHHKKLMSIYKVPEVPASLFDHWYIFKKIANFRFSNRFWQCQMLYFTDQWLEQLKSANTVPWLQFKNYLHQRVWHASEHILFHYNTIGLVKKVDSIVKKHHFHLCEYASSTVRQILSIQYGKMLGFRVSDGSEVALPEKIIQEAYVQDYKLKQYLPIIMHAAKWDRSYQYPLYYSVNFPIMINPSPPDMKNMRRTDLLHQVRFVLDRIAGADFHYEYVHHQQDEVQKIKQASDVFCVDPAVISLQQAYPRRRISCSNKFVKGCVTVTPQSAVQTKGIQSTTVADLFA